MAAGFFSMFAIIWCAMLPNILFDVKPDAFILIVGIAQIILLFIYILNWRWFFITWNIDYKKLIIFICLFMMFIVGFVITRNFSTGTNIWHLDYDDVLRYANGMKSVNISLLDMSLGAFTKILKTTDPMEIANFYTISVLFIYCLIGSLIVMNIFVNNKYSFKPHNIILLMISGLCISSLGFVFAGFMWIILLTLWLMHVHGLKQNELKSKTAIFIINSSVLAGSFFDVNFLVVALVINLIAIFVSYRTKKENATDYNVLMMFSTLLLISVSLRNELYIGFIVLSIVAMIYAAYMFYKSSKVAHKINKTIDYFMYENGNWLLIAVISAIILASTIFFLNSRNFKVYSDIWILTQIGSPTINIQNDEIRLLATNLIFWIMNVGIVIFSFINVKMTFSKNIFNSFNSKRKLSSPHLDWTIITTLLFWNPISGNLLSIFNEFQLMTFIPDFRVLFFAIACPPLLVTVKYLSQTRKISFLYFAYMGIIISIVGSFIGMINF
ncbi:MAG: hypothetical protein ACRC4M_03640 [Mycoplasma sp.]